MIPSSSFRRSTSCSRTLREVVIREAPLSDSPIHGVWHWDTVAAVGAGLIEAGARADPKVVALFALLHDACRVDENEDPFHAERGYWFARSLINDGLIDVNEFQRQKLLAAIRLHARGETTRDATIGVCWDADRLDLVRVDVAVRHHFLSTKQARRVLQKIPLDT